MDKASRQHVDAALEHVEEAQRELGRAASAVSSVCGLAREHRKLSRLYDQIHAYWYQLQTDAARRAIEVDHEEMCKEIACVGAREARAEKEKERCESERSEGRPSGVRSARIRSDTSSSTRRSADRASRR